MLDPTTIASLALATVTAALGVAAWLEGRQWQSHEATFGSAPDPRMVARYQQYRAAQSPGHTDLMISPKAIDNLDLNPWHSGQPLKPIATDITSAPSQPPKRRAF